MLFVSLYSEDKKLIGHLSSVSCEALNIFSFSEKQWMIGGEWDEQAF